jgi:hypothetical protein
MLRMALQTFLDGVSVTASAVDAPSNTLLNVNGRLQRSLGLVHAAAGPKLVTHQSLSLKSLSLQTTHPSLRTSEHAST